MARRPSQALETRALSASAASSRCSSQDRFTNTRCFEAIFLKPYRLAAPRCSTLMHFHGIPRRCQHSRKRAGQSFTYDIELDKGQSP